MPVRICFVCLGNICRSPTAEGVFLSLIEQAGLAHAFEVDSAGTAGYHAGEPADRRSARAARARGIDLPSRARRFVRADFERFDYVLAMDGSNLGDLIELAPTESARAKVRLLRSFDATAEPNAEVPDPYYGGGRGFEDVLDICERACEGLLEHVRNHHGLG